MTIIHFEIIGTNEADHTVTARYWTERLSVEMLGVLQRDNQGQVLSARTDVCVGVPADMPLDPESAVFRAFIESCAPRDWFETLEAKLDGGIGAIAPLLGAMGSLQDLVVREVQLRLDGMAKARGYDGIVSLCSYAGSSNLHFAADARHGLDVRDAAWSQCYQILDDVTAGDRPVPTLDLVLAEMPSFDWPN